MPSSSPQLSPDLKYPPVRVNQSLTKLDLDTLMMRSTTRRPEEPGSSLDDSTYELLGDSLLDASDDEAHTESIASTEGPTPDDTSDFSDDDNDYGTGDRDLQASSHSSHVHTPEQQSDAHLITSGEDSTLTEVPAYMEDSESTRKIKLDEQQTEESDVIQGSKVIKSLPDQTSELPQVLSRYGCPQIRLVVRAALSQRLVPQLDSYRILYIGMPEKWLEDAITSQIGAALTASPSTSRSVMVRGQIEPYGPVIHVYRCAQLKTVTEHEKLSHILVNLDDGRQLKFGPGLASCSKDRPDLVVICHPTIADSAIDVHELTSATEVFACENIPCVDLAQARPYGHGAPEYDSKSLRVCVEGRDDSKTDFELKEVLPLDYYTFTELEPLQVNRHLALISPHLFSAPNLRNDQGARKSWFGGNLNTVMKKLGPQWPLLKTIVISMVMLTLLPVVFRGAAHAPMFFQQSANIEPLTSISSQVPDTIPSTTPTALTSIEASIPSVSAVLPAPRELTLLPPQAKPPKRKLESKVEKTGGFEIRTSGDHQFVLNPSKFSISNIKKPQIQIQVSRDSQVVPVRYNRTLFGTYIVDLEQHFLLSTFNVSIATHSKPLLRQSFEITLGYKSKLDQFLDTATTNLINTESKLWNLSSSAVQHMRTRVAALEAVALPWVAESQWSGEQAAAHLRSAQRAAQRQLAMGTGKLKQVPGAAWSRLRQASAPVRTSTPMLKARANALRLRCKMEIAAGLSGKSAAEEQSWACAKVQAETQGKDQC